MSDESLTSALHEAAAPFRTVVVAQSALRPLAGRIIVTSRHVARCEVPRSRSTAVSSTGGSSEDGYDMYPIPGSAF